MFQSPETRGQGESTETTTEAQSEIQKIKNDVESIQTMIKDLEAKKTESMTPSEGAALLGVITRERARLTPLLIKLDQEEKALDTKYAVSALETSDEDAFDAALRRTGEMQEADRLDARRKIL